MRPLNLIVDVTNYVMLETGQPIHAYDSRDLAGKMLGVRVALEKESITTLDGQKRELTADDLIIFDAKGPVGIAGIMGGAKSEVKNDTSSIIIEVAHFSASRVRKTAKRFALHSEASHRFERGVDIERLDLVSWRVATLIEQCQTELMKLGTLTIKAPHIGKDLVDLYPEKIRPHRIAMRTERLKQFLNYPIDQTESSHILQRLGIECIDRTDGRAVYQIPSWRHDLEREVDLIEEVARLRGYEKISNTMPLMEIGPNYEDGMIDFVDDVKVATAIAGFTEVVNFPFMHSGDLTHLRLESEHPYRNSVRIANPLAEQDSLLVTSLLPLLLKAAQRNLRVGDTGVALFEVGRQFLDLQTKNSISAAPELAHCYALGRHISEQAKADQRVIERQVIAGIMTSPIVAKAWNNSSEEAASIYHMKATLECLALALGIPKHKMTVQPIREATYPWLHPGAAASVMWNNQHIGSFGEIHPETAKAYGFSTNDAPVVFEFDLELMYLSRTALKDISLSAYRFPGSSRDLAFIADVGLHHEQVISVINSFTKKKYLSRSHLFDIYTGTPIASGKKSMAYAFFFQSPDKTLTDKEVDDEFLQLTNWLKSNLAIELRT